MNRAERRHRTETIQARRVRVARDVMGYDQETIARLRGFYRKMDPHDCGKPGCMLCHSEKVLERRKRRVRDNAIEEEAA